MSARKRGLGRGLEALIREEAPANTVPVDRLEPNRFQPRTHFDDVALEELTDSIRSQGIVQPLVVTAGEGDRYTIVAGERRWRAARRAGLDTVPVVVREIADELEFLELALVENLQRDDLDPIEEAEAYRALQQRFELSQEEIGSRVGKSRTTVTNCLRLLRLPQEVQDLLKTGRLTAGQARPLLALDTEEQQIELANRAVRDGLNARQMERLTSKKPRRRKRREEQEVHAAAAAETLTKKLQTRVEIRRKGRGGWVRIHFASEDELMRIYDLLARTGRKG